MNRYIFIVFIAACLLSCVETKNKPTPKVKPIPTQTKNAVKSKLHPLCQIENVYPLQKDLEMKVSAMAFHGDDLYITVFSPNRQNKKAFKEGEIFKVTGLIGNSDRSKIKATRVCKNLYVLI